METNISANPKDEAIRLIEALPIDKIKVVIPFLQYLNFLNRKENGKSFDETDSIKQGIKELAQLKVGKLQPKSFDALLNEL